MKEFQKSNDYALMWEAYAKPQVITEQPGPIDPSYGWDPSTEPVPPEGPPQGPDQSGYFPEPGHNIETIEVYTQAVKEIVSQREQANNIPAGELWDIIPEVQWNGYIQMGFDEGWHPSEVVMQAQSDQ